MIDNEKIYNVAAVTVVPSFGWKEVLVPNFVAGCVLVLSKVDDRQMSRLNWRGSSRTSLLILNLVLSD